MALRFEPAVACTCSRVEPECFGHSGQADGVGTSFRLPPGPLRPNATSAGRSHRQRCQAASRSSGARARSTRGAGRRSRARHRHCTGVPFGVQRTAPPMHRRRATDAHLSAHDVGPAMSADPAAPAPTWPLRRIFTEPAGLYAEAIRNACQALERHRKGAPSRLVLVVSALPGEGAELFASNLAHYYAISGSPSLLVDADLRMKSLTRQLAGASRCGLLDQIASQSPIEEAILRDGMTGLYFLPASGPAPIPLSVPSALRSPAMADAIVTLKERFATDRSFSASPASRNRRTCSCGPGRPDRFRDGMAQNAKASGKDSADDAWRKSAQSCRRGFDGRRRRER